MTPEVSASEIRAASDALRRGDLVAFPTETVYGLGANGLDPTAVAKIYRLKGRPATNPLILHVASLEQIKPLVAEPLPAPIAQQLEALQDFWPGPLTIVLPKSDRVPECVTANQPTVALRIPEHPVARALLSSVDFPIAAPSANRSTHVSPTRAEDVQDEFGDQSPIILEGGPCRCGLESTIVSLVSDPPAILRPGTITAEEIAAALGVSTATLLGDASQPQPLVRTPGQSPLHYAPTTPVKLLSEWSATDADGDWALIAFTPKPAELRSQFAAVTSLSMDGDLNEVAQQLFATLRDLDEAGYDGLVVDTCPDEGVGRAIMDRLRRAVARST